MSPLSPRDAACLRALVAAEPGASTKHLRVLAGGAGKPMPLATWQRGVAALASAGLVRCATASAGRFDVTTYSLTESGRSVAADQPAVSAGWSWVGERVGRGLVLRSSSSSLNSSVSKEKKEEREESQPTYPPDSGLVSGLVASLPPELVARVLVALESALNRVGAVDRCTCGRPIVTASGRYGDYRTCQAKKRCPHYEPKKAGSDGPRVSSDRSQREREQRHAAPKPTNEPGPLSKARTLTEALAESKKVS